MGWRYSRQNWIRYSILGLAGILILYLLGSYFVLPVILYRPRAASYGVRAAQTRTPAPTLSLAQSGAASGNIPGQETLQQALLKAVNQVRAEQGLTPVAWDPLAAQVGQVHAQEMADHNYLSHWDLAGMGPDLRYSQAGGTEWIQENVYSSWKRYTDGTPVAIIDWWAEVLDSHQALLNSPGHRANILNPDHTHVGFGMAYNPATGEFRLTQEFLNRYVRLDPLPSWANPGQVLAVGGEMASGCSQPLINTAYQPIPAPMTVEQLNATTTYASPAQTLEAIPSQVGNDNRFAAAVQLGLKPGLYHILIWVTCGQFNPHAVDWVVWVGD